MLNVSPGYGTVKIQTLKTTSLGMSKRDSVSTSPEEITTSELTEACMRLLITMTTATPAHGTLVSRDPCHLN